MLFKTRGSLKERMKSASNGASPIKLYWLYGGDLWIVSFWGRERVCYRSRCGAVYIPARKDWVTMRELGSCSTIKRRLRWPEILCRSVWEGVKWMF